jgi:hypothetical protein
MSPAVLLLAAFMNLFALFGTPARPENCFTRCHTVQPGETLWGIWQDHGGIGTWQDLAIHNHLNSTSLQPGQYLNLPPAWPDKSDWFTPEDESHFYDYNPGYSYRVLVAPKGTIYEINRYGSISFANKRNPDLGYFTSKEWIYHVSGTECIAPRLLGITICNGIIRGNVEDAFWGNGRVIHAPSFKFSTFYEFGPNFVAGIVGNNFEWMDSIYFDPVTKNIYSWALQIRPSGDGYDITVHNLNVLSLASTNYTRAQVLAALCPTIERGLAAYRSPFNVYQPC